VDVDRLARRLFPVIAAAGLVIAGMLLTMVGPLTFGKTAWALPDDLWGTLTAAQRLVHLDIGGLYTQPTGLIAFPGAALILIPPVALMDATGLPLALQAVHNPHPVSWLIAGPYEIALSAVVLFATDSIAERQCVPRPRRFLLAMAGAVAVWSVCIRWGHPEDAVAVGLLLYGIQALADDRPGRSGWLTGAAIAVQPLVLLALPVIAVAVWRQSPDGGPRRLTAFTIRAAIPAVVMVGAAAAANWHATVTALTSQPNFPAIDHPTPWTSLAPHLAGGGVAAGPGRILAIVFACGCAAVFAFSRGYGDDPLTDLLWWVAVALALRCVFESVMVAYYVWPALAVALVAASECRSRFLPVCIAAIAVTLAAQLDWRGAWGWWALMVAGLAATLYLSRRSQPALVPRPLASGAPLRAGALRAGDDEIHPEAEAGRRRHIHADGEPDAGRDGRRVDIEGGTAGRVLFLFFLQLLQRPGQAEAGGETDSDVGRVFLAQLGLPPGIVADRLVLHLPVYRVRQVQ
jgi:hypothetical protein